MALSKKNWLSRYFSKTGEGKLEPEEEEKDAYNRTPTFTVKVGKNGEKTYHIVVSPFIDEWAERRKALLILGLVFCQQAIKGDNIDRIFLEEQNVEPEIIDAALTLVTVMFGDEKCEWNC